MSRPRTFDDEKVLDAAIGCFWHRGLESTSLRDLTEAMSINAPSLYNAFGDKRQLFILALERYANTSMRARLALMREAPAPKQVLKSFLLNLVERSCADPDRRGCLIINTALEVAPHDPEIASIVRGYLDELLNFIRGRIVAAQAAGECDRALDVEAVSAMLLGQVAAVRLLSRTGADKKQLELMLQPAFAILDAGVSPTKH
ncbi:MAG: TetR/AcrR family transcriptional regulator [Hyphomicrobiaceae bacterium]